MKSTLLRSLSVLAVLSVPLVATVAPAVAAGELVIEEKSWDAGEIELGDVFEHDFIFTNKGDTVVRIKDVLPQCGCTVPEYPKQIAPGESAAVKLQINTKTLHSGKLSKTTTVLTDAPGSERVILQIKMKLYTALEFLPKPLVYLRSMEGQEREEKVLARPHRANMKLTSVESNNPNIVASIEPVHVAGKGKGPGLVAAMIPREGDSWISLRLLPAAPVGIHRAEVVVRTTDPDFPEAVVRVSAVVKEATADGSR